VALGSDLAEAVLTTDRAAAVGALVQRAHSLLGMNHEQFNEVVARVLNLIPETEELYETSIIGAEEADNLLSEASELLAVRNLHALQEVSTLQARTGVLLARTEEAEDSSRRDPLTGALNRPWFDRLLDREFTQAVVFGRDLSVAHVDIDRFKIINDRYGAQVGDKVLQSCAGALLGCVRERSPAAVLRPITTPCSTIDRPVIRRTQANGARLEWRLSWRHRAHEPCRRAR
jgi:predicted signal transduction protein with EAL and GGDEF domain